MLLGWSYSDFGRGEVGWIMLCRLHWDGWFSKSSPTIIQVRITLHPRQANQRKAFYIKRIFCVIKEDGLSARRVTKSGLLLCWASGPILFRRFLGGPSSALRSPEDARVVGSTCREELGSDVRVFLDWADERGLFVKEKKSHLLAQSTESH